MSNLTKQVVRWKKVNKDCDHTNHPEKIGDTQVCFCTKLSDVIRTNLGITSNEFSQAIGYHTIMNADPEEIREIVEAFTAHNLDKIEDAK